MPLTDPPLIFGTARGDSSAKFFTNYAGVITDYEVRSKYYKDGHVYALGCASPAGFRGVTTAFVQLSSSVLLWIADWTVQSNGAEPIIPSPFLVSQKFGFRTIGARGDPIWILMDEHYEAAQIELDGDGITPIYRLSGIYVFGCLNPSSVTVRDIVFPKSPYVKDGPPREYDERGMVNGIINE